MVGSNSNTTILMLNVNGLNTPVKRHRLANWIKSQDPSECYFLETHLTCKDSHRLKGLEEDLPSKWRAKAGVAILVSDKIDFKATKIQW